MKVELLVSLSGANGAFDVGSEYVCASADEAQRLIEKGIAKPIRQKKVERAVKKRKKAEKAVK